MGEPLGPVSSEADELLAPSRARTLAGAVGAPLAFVIVWFADLPLEPAAHRLAAIFGAVLIAWVTEVIPIAATALLIAPLLVVTGVENAKDAFKSYADPLLYLFVGGFFIAESMRRHGLDRRIAGAIVGSRWVAGVPSRVRLALMVAGVLLSMWISNTASAAILAPIFLGMARGRGKETTGTLLALAYACSAGGLGTVVGSPPNLITVRILREGGVSLSFVDWMMVGLPTALVVSLAVFLVSRWMFPTGPAPEETAEETAEESAKPEVPARMTRGEVVTAVAFGLAVVGWTVPGVAQALELSVAATLKTYLHPGVVALGAASLLFMAPAGKGERVLRWKDAAQIDWGIILLFGGGIALGTQLVETGLAGAMSQGFVAVTGIRELWTFTAVCCAFTIFFTEVCSNTASATMLVPLVVGVATQLGISPVPPALAVGLAASCAFMLPIATGPNAVVYSTGRVSQTQMMRFGVVLNLISVAVVFLLLRVLCPLLGWV